MSAIWPTAVASDNDLYIAVNSLQTTLAVAIGTGDTSIVLSSTTGFPTAGGMTIENEVIFYTGISGNTMTGCTRAADGTVAATHSVGVAAGASIIAFHHNGLKDEIEAIESYLDTVLGKGTTVTSVEFGYLSGVTSALQTQLDAKADDSAVVHNTGAETVAGAKTFSSAVAVSPTSNQIVLGATRTVTVTAPTPATASRTWTIPDITADGTFAALEGTQTFSGTKTFSAAVTISPTSSQLVLGATRTVTVTAPTPATSSRTWTIPDISGNGTFAALEGAQTFTGDKTFSGTVDVSGLFKGKGRTDASTPAAGYLSETLSAQLLRSSGAALTTNVAVNVTSKALTAGLWLVIAQFGFGLTSGTPNATSLVAAISTTSATIPGTNTTAVQDAAGQIVGKRSIAFTSTSADDDTLSVFSIVNISTTTTYYAVAQATFASGGIKASGSIYAIRIG